MDWVRAIGILALAIFCIIFWALVAYGAGVWVLDNLFGVDTSCMFTRCVTVVRT